jgi:hypothetical protein
VFASGQFAPATLEGRRLIAHELTHIVQQNGNEVTLQREPKSPKDRAAYELLLEDLRAQMAKPRVTDPKLAKIIEKLYRDNPEIGSGSTGAAIRHELETGMATKGTRHMQAGQERMTMLADWLKEQKKLAGQVRVAPGSIGSSRTPPGLASPQDVATAEHLFKDLQQAVDSGYYADFQIDAVTPPSGTGGGDATKAGTDVSGTTSGEAKAEQALVEDTKAVSKAGKFGGFLGKAVGFAAPLLDAYLMLLSYRDVNVDSSAFAELSAKKLQPIVEDQLKARSAEITNFASGPDALDALYGIYANVRCELHYRFVPDPKGQSLGKLQLYDLRFLDIGISAHDENKSTWDTERSRKENESIQQVTLSVLVYTPPGPPPPSYGSERPAPEEPLYFRSQSGQNRLQQPITPDELFSWARRRHPRLFDDPSLTKEVLSSADFTGSQKAREDALRDLRRRVQEEEIYRQAKR